eukprot:6057057-Pleurochrysis_carterae.AAC.1
MTVPTVTITHYWSNSACGWEPHIKGTTYSEVSGGTDYDITGSVDPLATDLQVKLVGGTTVEESRHEEARLTACSSLYRIIIIVYAPTFLNPYYDNVGDPSIKITDKANIMADHIGCVKGREGSTVRGSMIIRGLPFRQHSRERTSYLEFERTRYDSFRPHLILLGGGDRWAI